MIRRLGLGASAILCVAAVAWPEESGPPTESHHWPAWRGPLGTGVAVDSDPPLRWSDTENIRWKTELPGRGHSTPIVWGERVFLTAAVPHGERLDPEPFNIPPEHDNVGVTRRLRFCVLAIDLRSGNVLWERTVADELPHEGGHETGSLASASPVTDGEILIASFGSYGLFALDLEGEVIWSRDLGDMHTKHKHGEGSSPALYGDTVVVNWDHEGSSFLVALDKRSGEVRWQVDRDEVTSWSSPIVVDHDGAAQVIVNGTNRVRGYDLANGDVLWECGGLSNNVIATPVHADGMVYAGSSYEKKAMLGIRLDGAKGDLTGGENVAWFRRRGTPYVPSPLLYDDRLYFLTHYQGVLTIVDRVTGEVVHGPLRLGGIYNVYASLAGAAGRVYITDTDGTTLVLNHEGEPKVLAENRLDDVFCASPAFVGDDLLLRGARHLYCLREP